MKKVSAAILTALALALAAGAAAAGPTPPGELPALTRIASKLSGIEPERPVAVRTVGAAAMAAQARRLLDRDYPLDQQRYDETVYRALGLLGPGETLRPLLLASATRNVQGLYDPQRRVLYVRSGAKRRAALLSGIVRALEDQAFDLRRMSDLRRSNRDAAIAAAAAVDGDAAFAAQVIGGKSYAFLSRRPAAVADPMQSFLQLEQDFPGAVGVRFVTTLHNLGGNKAVFSALRQFPTTTEQVFHIDAFLTREPALPVQLPASVSGLTLRRSDTFGELDVRALLAVFQVPRLDVAASGWGGGRTALYTDGAGRTTMALVLDWDTDVDAQEWAEAVATYVNEAFDPDTPGFPPTTPCGSDTCWSVGGRQVAFALDGSRTALVFGTDVPTADALADAAVGG